MSCHERREAVQQATHACRHAARGKAPDEEECGPRGQRNARGHQDVVGKHKAGQMTDRCEGERRNEGCCIPHQVDAGRIVDVVSEEWILSMGVIERSPPQELTEWYG